MKSKAIVSLMLKEGLRPEYRGFGYLAALMALCPLEGAIPPLAELYDKAGEALGVSPSAVMQGIRLCIQQGNTEARSNRAMVYRLRALRWKEVSPDK